MSKKRKMDEINIGTDTQTSNTRKRRRLNHQTHIQNSIDNEQNIKQKSKRVTFDLKPLILGANEEEKTVNEDDFLQIQTDNTNSNSPKTKNELKKLTANELKTKMTTLNIEINNKCPENDLINKIMEKHDDMNSDSDEEHSDTPEIQIKTKRLTVGKSVSIPTRNNGIIQARISMFDSDNNKRIFVKWEDEMTGKSMYKWCLV
eukprot:330872_1